MPDHSPTAHDVTRCAEELRDGSGAGRRAPEDCSRATTFELNLLAKALPELRHHLRAHDFEVHLWATGLLTNVIDHLGEGTPVTIRVTGTPHGHTRVEVTDPDPRALPAADTAESGRSLTLVDGV
ncbi:ATP-binding protein [Streptomyces sp. NPDC058755]|uniref:ATP-binding protein n=1 Tax=Streptomyces sp. NPDC058755 TaxID=3346624 RepID=UPI0036D0CCE3